MGAWMCCEVRRSCRASCSSTEPSNPRRPPRCCRRGAAWRRVGPTSSRAVTFSVRVPPTSAKLRTTAPISARTSPPTTPLSRRTAAPLTPCRRARPGHRPTRLATSTVALPRPSACFGAVFGCFPRQWRAMRHSWDPPRSLVAGPPAADLFDAGLEALGAVFTLRRREPVRRKCRRPPQDVYRSVVPSTHSTVPEAQATPLVYTSVHAGQSFTRSSYHVRPSPYGLCPRGARRSARHGGSVHSTLTTRTSGAHSETASRTRLSKPAGREGLGKPRGPRHRRPAELRFLVGEELAQHRILRGDARRQLAAHHASVTWCVAVWRTVGPRRGRRRRTGCHPTPAGPRRSGRLGVVRPGRRPSDARRARRSRRRG